MIIYENGKAFHHILFLSKTLNQSITQFTSNPDETIKH